MDPVAPYARLAVVLLIHAPDARLLLVRPTARPELWCPPGGRLEAGETLEEAALREVREETGFRVEVAGPCYAYLGFHKGERTLAVSMACRVGETAPPPALDPAEALDWRWVTPEEWRILAAAGRSVWTARDVERGTALASRLMAVAFPEEEKHRGT